MKITRTTMLKIIISAIFITNCTNNNDSKAEDLFAEMYKNCEMNTLLEMSFEGRLYEGDRNVHFSIVPTSKNSVIFPSGFNIKLLSFDIGQGEWIEIKNNVQYLPEDAKYIIGRNDPTKEYEYKLIGVTPFLDKKSDLRIVMHGHIYDNGVETDRCTGAFLDFEYIP